MDGHCVLVVPNHPFSDGNKRTGYGAMMMFLSRNAIPSPLRWTSGLGLSGLCASGGREKGMRRALHRRFAS